MSHTSQHTEALLATIISWASFNKSTEPSEKSIYNGIVQRCVS